MDIERVTDLDRQLADALNDRFQRADRRQPSERLLALGRESAPMRTQGAKSI